MDNEKYDEAIEATNEIMDYLRDRFSIDPDSDADDEIYGEIFKILRPKE